MSDLVGAGTNNGATVSALWKASNGNVYQFSNNAYIGGITNDAVVAALEGDKYVTVAMYVYGNTMTGCPFGYGDGSDGLKYMFNGTTASLTTKGVADFASQVLGSMNADAWNIVAFTIPGKTSANVTAGSNVRLLSPAGHYSKTYNTSNMKNPDDGSKKFAIGSGDQGTAREAFNGMLANVTVISSDGQLSIQDIQTLVGNAPVYAETKSVSVTYRYNGSNDNTLVQEVTLPLNTTEWISIAALDYFTCTSATDIITEETTSVIVDAVPAFPFQTNKFYQIKNVNQNYVKNVGAALTDKNASNNVEPNQLWYFEPVAGTFNQYKIRCVANGQAWNGTSGTVTLADDGTAYQILKAKSGFNIFSGNANGYVGAHINYNGANNAVGYWYGGNATEPGSQWTVFEYDPSLVNALYASSTSNVNLVGGADNYETGHAAYVAYESSKTRENLVAVLNAYNNATINEIEVNKFYTLRENVRANNQYYIGAAPNADTEGVVINSNRTINCLPSNNSNYTFINSLFKFEASEDKYFIQHVNSGLYICTPSRGNPTDLPLDKQYAGTFSVIHYSGDNAQIGLYNGTNMYLNTNNTLTEVHGWNGSTIENSPGNRWTIAEVTEIPVTIGSVGYSTACFPMNVVIPNTVEAYIINENNASSVSLAQVEGILPAGQGVILKNEGSHSFTITSDAATADVEDNLLTGTTVRRLGFGENANYVLANKTNGVGLYLNGTVEAVPANKAYMSATAGSSSAAMLTFDFDGAIETAINELEAEKLANSTIYDVQGRRVMNPTKGLYIVNGKKVMFK